MDDVTEPRHIRDVRALASLTHPARQRLLDVLELDGPATASMLAERTDQAVGNVSHHLRVLAEAELIELAPELARDRRERWWRLTSRDIRWARGDFEQDAPSEAVAQAAASLLLDRQLGYVRRWLGERDRYDDAWREGCAVATERWVRVTPDEARQLADDLTQVLNRWSARDIPDDGQRRESLLAFAHTVPAEP